MKMKTNPIVICKENFNAKTVWWLSIKINVWDKFHLLWCFNSEAPFNQVEFSNEFWLERNFSIDTVLLLVPITKNNHFQTLDEDMIICNAWYKDTNTSSNKWWKEHINYFALDFDMKILK